MSTFLATLTCSFIIVTPFLFIWWSMRELMGKHASSLTVTEKEGR